MVLPSAEGSPDDFIQQSILSLQHLWRIGVEMGVVWWTSAVSYIPRSSLSQAAEKGHVAGQAWIFRHRQMSPADEDEQERDLWEERHHGGLESRGRNQAARQLPDWEIIDSGSLGTESHPPSFTAEVEELPRGSGIEWHAHVGLSEGPLQVLTKELPEVGAISQCTVANEVQYTTIMLSYAEELHDVNDRVSILKGLLEDRLELGGAEIGDHAAYVDVSITGLCQKADLRGVVPCRSLWDIKGERLAAVFLYCARARPKD
jgi:diphthine-ammonia ligase